jgi:uncharacterized protein YpmB
VERPKSPKFDYIDVGQEKKKLDFEVNYLRDDDYDNFFEDRHFPGKYASFFND